MNKSTWLIVVLIFPLLAFAQGKYDANWCFGNNAGIDFNDTSNLMVFVSQSNSIEANASISDSIGQLLFYLSNDNQGYPFRIKNKNNNVILNGDSILLLDTYTNGISIVPIPNSQTKWFVFHLVGNNLNNQKFGYSIVEIDSNGLKVTAKNVVLLNNIVEEKIALVKHANGKDWWVLLHQSFADTLTQSTNRFYEFLVNSDSIFGPFIQDIGSQHYSFLSYIGEMTFSATGKNLACSISDQNSVDLFDFDRCSGTISNPVALNDINHSNAFAYSYGCEFSSDGSKLYVAQNRPNGLFQFDLTAANILGSKKTLWQDSVTTGFMFGQLQIAPNDKIYMASPTNNRLSVINYPNVSDTLCGFQLLTFFLDSSSRASYGLPNVPNYNLGPIGVYASNAGKDTIWCSDSTEGIQIGSPVVPNIVYHWSPGKGLTDSTIAQPLAHPDSSTYYILTVTDTSQSGNSCASTSDTVFVRMQKCDTVGINEISQSKLKVYPNPVNNALVVESSTNDNRFVLYDAIGSIVFEHKISIGKNFIDVSFLSSGFYVYRMGFLSGKMQVTH